MFSRQSIRTSIGCAAVSVILLLFSACENEHPSRIELTFWAMGAEGESIGQLIPEFEAAHPDIHVTVQSIPWGAAHEKLLTAYAGQSTPDVCQLGNTWIPEFQAIDAILPLDSLICSSAIVAEDRYFKGIWDTNVLAGSAFGIPWYVDTRLLFYRTDLLNQAGTEPPQTWVDWRRVSRKIRELSTPEDPSHAVFFPLGVTDWQIPVILILQNGGRLLKQNDCYAAFDDPATVEALEYYLSFFEEELAVRKMTEVSNVYQAFEDGVFSMMITGPWNVSYIRRRVPALAGKWSTAVLPGKKNRASVAGGASLVIFKNSRHPDAAWKFVEFLSRPETQVKFFKLTRDLPAVKASWNSEDIQSDPQITAFFEQLEHVVPTPRIAEWEQIAVKIQEHLERVVYGKITLRSALPELNRDVDQILEKRRWLISRGLIHNSQ